jgi:hypothetical protein
MLRPTIRRGAQAVVAQCVTAFSVLALSVLSWLQAERVTDDRGSDSSEKAFMVILAIALGGAVSAAAIAFVAGKTSLFQ